MEKLRYVVSPFTWTRNNKPRTWSVWDRESNMWAGSPVYCIGSRSEAEAAAHKLNNPA